MSARDTFFKIFLFCRRRSLRRSSKVIQRRSYAAFPMRYTRQIESHLDTAQGARQHEGVEIPKMADPKYFVLQAAKAAAKTPAEVSQNRFSTGAGRRTAWRIESGHRMTV